MENLKNKNVKKENYLVCLFTLHILLNKWTIYYILNFKLSLFKKACTHRVIKWKTIKGYMVKKSPLITWLPSLEAISDFFSYTSFQR